MKKASYRLKGYRIVNKKTVFNKDTGLTFTMVHYKKWPWYKGSEYAYHLQDCDEPEEDTFDNPEIPASAFDAIREADS
jgi:hypothetical protein